MSLITQLNSPSPNEGAQFGEDVAVEGRYTIVGAWRDNSDAEQAGAVYVYDTATGTFLRELQNPNPEAFDEFGSAIDIDGTRVAVGARQKNTNATNSGVVYIFDAETGNLLKQFENPEPGVDDRFGRAVEISGDRLLVSAYTDTTGSDPAQFQAGSAYLFDLTDDSLIATYQDPTPFPRGQGFYSARLGLDGDNAIIGNYRDSDVDNQGGSVEIVDAETGDVITLERNPDPDPNGRTEFFGWDIAVKGDAALIGAVFDRSSALQSGTVYLYDFLVQDFVGEVINPTPDVNDFFGLAVALGDSYFAISAVQDDLAVQQGGTVYVYERGSNRLIDTLTDPNTPQTGERFGSSLAIDGNTLIVGTGRDGDIAPQAGSAFLYTIAPVPLLGSGSLVLAAFGVLGFFRMFGAGRGCRV
ncbi:MAG: hypothetical protein AAGF71_04310 [Pseudomonadota bacterium]